MNIDLDSLDARQFELLCAALLRAEGYTTFVDFTGVKQWDRGYDFLCLDPSGVATVVEAKRIAAPVFLSALRRIAEDLWRAVALKETTQALLIVSVPLKTHIRDRVAEGFQQFIVWDGDYVKQLLAKHAHVSARFEAIEIAQEAITKFVSKDSEGPTPKRDTAAELIETLEGIPPGAKCWREYEKICQDILVYAFVPPLRVPLRQSGTTDKLDRRDLVFPLGSSHPFWDRVRIDFGSRVIVAECKNSNKPIGQKEVESFQQYLFAGAMRSLGLLCCRAAPSLHAQKARRRAWALSKSMIVFLTDEDMKELVRRRSLDADVTELIDLQLDEFFVSLAP